MRPVRTFVVESDLPAHLRPLAALARNWHWSWRSEIADLFHELDPVSWQSSHGVPVRALRIADSQRLAAVGPQLAERAAHMLVEIQDRSNRWFAGRTNSSLRSVAYFSPEFGVSEALPQYSGGLGILAGDHLKSCSDLGVPLVGVGLFYRFGYFRQEVGVDGWQREQYPEADPEELGLTDTGKVIEINLVDRVMSARVWRADVGNVALLLLDTDLDSNPSDLRTADRLYGGDREHRLHQEMLLGIGGVRALRAVGLDPQLFHSNEGHAGFLTLERVREHVANGMAFDQAVEIVRSSTVFTTHTPVPAGIDRFGHDLIRRYLAGMAQDCGVSIDRLISIGQHPDEPGEFNMAVLGLRMSGTANGVAALHGDVSRTMFSRLWPDLEPNEVPIGSITNGVHAPTWTGPEVASVLANVVGENWDGANADTWRRALDIQTNDLEVMRAAGKLRLVQEVRERVGDDTVLSPTALTIGFARRFATYKRATLLLSQPQRLERLLASHPIQFVFAGKAHPADDEGKRFIQAIAEFSKRPSAAGRFLFIENYDMGLAGPLEHGCDVWLNTPRRPMEACGTSGMKAALNGALNCSIPRRLVGRVE